MGAEAAEFEGLNPDWEILEKEDKGDYFFIEYNYPSKYDTEMQNISGINLYSRKKKYITEDMKQKLYSYLSEQTGEKVIGVIYLDTDDGYLTLKIEKEKGDENTGESIVDDSAENVKELLQ